MTALLTDNLPLLAAAPNGIKKLRELILELAVRGKLVPQDPSDEPASELLRRIAEEKARLVAEGKLKKKSLLEMTGEEQLYHLPSGWEWCKLSGLIPDFQNGASSRGDASGINVTVLRLADIKSGEISLEDTRNMTLEAATVSKHGLESGDILLIRVNGSADLVGRFIVCRNELQAIPCDHFIRMRFPKDVIDSAYLKIVGDSALVRQAIAGLFVSTAGQKTVNQGHIGSLPIPLPPLAEQHSIVAKVDELMALCDRLEAQQADAESAHAQLVQALLDSLTQASDANDFATNWQRLAEHFHTLFTTEPSIDALEQALLQLAVMGKLVPQESGDEPASELLKRIAEEKEQLVNKGKIRRQKPLREITEEEKPYELPATWAWTQLGSQVLESGAGWSPSCEARPRDGDEGGVLKVSAVSWGIYRPEENKALPPNLEARPEHEVAKGDFLVSRANTAELVARSVVVEETPKRLMLSDKIVRLKLTPMCAPRYMNLANSVPLARRYYSQVAGGTSSSMKNVSREQILNLPIALPPLAEQHRIVAKFDSLVSLCGTLKRQINAATEKQIALLNAFMAKV